MELMLSAVSVFTVVVTCTFGYFIIQKFFPDKNKEIEIINAFKQEDYQKVIALTEGREQNTRNSLNVYIFAAQARSKLQEYEAALLWWEIALTKMDLLNSDQIFIELEIGDIYFNLQNFKKSEIHYRTAVTISPSHVKANYKLASALYYQNTFEVCRKILRSLLKTNPSLIDSRKLYAECLASLNLYNKAIRHYGILERINENTITYNYAKTLKKLKIWDKAYHAYSSLLPIVKEKETRESIICDLVEICVSMKRYHEGLGMIDLYLAQELSSNTRFELKYIRANIFFLKGDQMIALQEYQSLYQEKPFYKDLDAVIKNHEYILQYPFLFNYFTSNEQIFESLIIRLGVPGMSILRRAPNYFMGLKDNTAYVFYRDIRGITEQLLKEIDHHIFHLCPTIETFELWSLPEFSGNYYVSGHKYRLIPRYNEEFLVKVNIAVSQMDYLEEGAPLNFVEGFRNVPEIIPITSPQVEPLLEEILQRDDEFLKDELLSKALE